MQLHRFGADGMAGQVQNIAQSFASWHQQQAGHLTPWAPPGHCLRAGYWAYRLPDGAMVAVRLSAADCEAIGNELVSTV